MDNLTHHLVGHTIGGEDVVDRLVKWKYNDEIATAIQGNQYILPMFHSKGSNEILMVPSSEALVFKNGKDTVPKIKTMQPLSGVDLIDIYAEAASSNKNLDFPLRTLIKEYTWRNCPYPYDDRMDSLNAVDFSLFTGKDLFMKTFTNTYFVTGVFVPLAMITPPPEYELHKSETLPEDPEDAHQLTEIHVADLQFVDPMPPSGYGRVPVVPNPAVVLAQLAEKEKNVVDRASIPIMRESMSTYTFVTAISSSVRNNPSLTVLVHFLSYSCHDSGAPIHASVPIPVPFPLLEEPPFQEIAYARTMANGQVALQEVTRPAVVTSRFSSKSYLNIIQEAFDTMMSRAAVPLFFGPSNAARMRFFTAAPLYMYMENEWDTWYGPSSMGQPYPQEKVCVDQLFLGQTALVKRLGKTPTQQKTIFLPSIFVHLAEELTFPEEYIEPPDVVPWSMYKNPYTKNTVSVDESLEE